MRWFQGKQLLSQIRGGDYAHPGEDKAIDIALSPYKKDVNRKILDVGCGLGKTADYIQKKHWGAVSGFDIEKESVMYAKQTYPDVSFYVSDVHNVDSVINTKFDLLCLFTTFYAFVDQEKALYSLNKITENNGEIMIFDYSDREQYFPSIFRFDENPFLPIKQGEIAKMLARTNWNISSIVNMNEKFLTWYETLMNKIEAGKNDIINTFGESAFNSTYDTYHEIVTNLQKNMMGGVIVYAKKMNVNL